MNSENKTVGINTDSPVINTDEKKPVATQKKQTFVDPVIRANRPYGIIRNRQEQMDKLFIDK